MVCDRCIMAVRSEAQKLNLHPTQVMLGSVEFEKELNPELLKAFHENLNAIGFDLIDDRKSRLAEKIKTSLVGLLKGDEYHLNVNLSEYLSASLNLDYTYLSNLFSEIEGITLEKYFIKLKVEKIKELMVYDELSLKEIAFNLNYSSVAHLSTQFKKATGFTPSAFRKMNLESRKALDKV